ncbi:unnamed protein product [Adineta steineri]|uniref:G-protein coupled receptors family 1 profile domain-containing protein n=1 Tax=Adineta steineri TaxID=433720 RepID=A0A815ESG9_9BILA|nr:unnamed protein product [Adineta steineri]CAF1581539.1 unnamed protein product [Adineta steineri]
MSLLYISQQVTIYLGFFLLVVGVIGNGINILVFSSVRTYRKSPCTFYFLIASIINVIYIIINLISRIVSAGYGIDLTRTSSTWCRTRQYLIGVFSLISITCSCLATIDQFLLTSRNAYLRSLSNIILAHRIVLIVVIVGCIHTIPCLIFFDISPVTKTCVNINAVYNYYVIVYVLTVTCMIPVIIMIIFGYLTYRNIHLTKVLAQQQADRQLIRMTLIEVVLVVFTITPYGINNAYSLASVGVAKNADRLMSEYFASTMISLLTYFYYAGSCYMFFISSSRFRRTVREKVFFWQRSNQVQPLQQVTLTVGITTFPNKINN